MATRLVIVSNRVAAPEPGSRAKAGGLAVAVKAALKHRNGLWFGWSGDVYPESTRPFRRSRPWISRNGHLTFALFDLCATDFHEYYSGFANRVLWPILHYRVNLQDYSRADATGYLRVNRLFAETLSPLLNEDDIVWVHDYHLMPLARELRGHGHKNPLGFFLHIPCAPPDILEALPHHENVLGALTDFDLVGFQTQRDCDNFAEYLLSLGAKRGRGDEFEISGRRTRLGVFPVGIETRAFARLARRAGQLPDIRTLRETLSGGKLIIAVDRLDYSKGILNRIHAFDRFLEMSPEWRCKATLLQIAPKSRSEIKEYADIENAVAELVGKVNGRHGEPQWTPIHYVNRVYPRAVLAGLYRIADAALVTPCRDGMNLVAKEFLAAQDPDNPGVLVLSEFAGAAAEVERALIVNPHEFEGVAAALWRALEMPRDERRERHAPMLAHLVKADSSRWADDFLTALAETRQRPGLFEGMRAWLGVAVNAWR